MSNSTGDLPYRIYLLSEKPFVVERACIQILCAAYSARKASVSTRGTGKIFES